MSEVPLRSYGQAQVGSHSTPTRPWGPTVQGVLVDKDTQRS